MDTERDLESSTHFDSSDDYLVQVCSDDDDPFNFSEITTTSTYQDRTTNTPTSSPIQKKAHPQVLSSIRKALEMKGEPRGVLKKSTAER